MMLAVSLEAVSADLSVLRLATVSVLAMVSPLVLELVKSSVNMLALLLGRLLVQELAR